MENTDLPLAILNLTGELPQELAEYFAKRQITVVNPLENKEKFKWTHVLVKDLNDFTLIRQTYKTIENDIKIISLTKVSDPQNFFQANGRLIVDELWMKGQIGAFILDKFFQEYAGVDLSDNYPKFEEKGSFNVANPFSTGDYLDRLVFTAFQSDFAALSVKTYFDHFLMYATGLKAKSKVSLPIEVTYGLYEDFFGLQFHFFAEGLTIEDISGSLGIPGSKAEEYLLNIAVNSVDFFDFSYLSQVKKVVVTALWTKDVRINMENRGLMFTTLKAGAKLPNVAYEGSTSQLIDAPAILDVSEKIVLPEGKSDESLQIVSGEEVTEAIAEKLSSGIDLEQLQEILNSDVQEEETDKVVLGSKAEMDDIINKVQGSLEKAEDAFKVKGGKLDVDDFAMRISSTMMEEDKGNMKVQSLGAKLPENLKKGLYDFATKLGKEIEAINDEDLHTFKLLEIPQIVKNTAVVGNTLSKALLDDLKTKLESNLKSEFMAESEDSIQGLLTNLGTDDNRRVQEIFKESLKSSIDSNFTLSESEALTSEEQSTLIKTLSTALNEDENAIREIVIEESKSGPVSLFEVPPVSHDPALLEQVKSFQLENENLRGKIKTLMSEVRLLKEARTQMSTLQAAAAATSANELEMETPALSPEEIAIKESIVEKLNSGATMSLSEQKKMLALMEREAKLVELTKAEELKARRLNLEFAAKESMYLQEIDKSSRAAKAKDLMLTKTKEVMQKMIEKKDSTIEGLTMKIDSLSVALSSGAGQAQVQQLKDLEKQNANQTRLLETYKAKIATMINQMQNSKATDDNSKEEVRKLQMINMQFKNQLDTVKRELTKYQDKVSADTAAFGELKQEKAKLEAQLKKMTFEQKKESEAQAPSRIADIENELKVVHEKHAAAEAQVRELTTKLKETEIKLAEVMKQQVLKAGGNEEISKRIAHFEKTNKKLTEDLTVAKNETVEAKKEIKKVQAEKVAMQNVMDKMKKDLEKAGKERAASVQAAGPNTAKKDDPKGGAGGKAA